MLTAYGFMAVNLLGYYLGIKKGPIWALLVYVNVYFNVPHVDYNWWASYLPFARWNLLSSAILILSVYLHRDKLSEFNLHSYRWIIVFFALSAIIVLTVAVNHEAAVEHLYLLFTFCVITFIMIKVLNNVKTLQIFMISIIILAANLSLNAYLYGERVNNRLENIGTSDTVGANEFGLLLAGVIPLILPFIMTGKKNIKIVMILATPFLLNAFILCNSRGSFIAFVLAIFISFIIIADMKVKKIMIVLGIIVMSAFIYLSDESFVKRMDTLTTVDSALQNESAAARVSSGRTEIWSYGIKMVRDYPFGAGPNGFKELARFYMPEELLTFHPGEKYGIRAAHSTYLQVLVEQGYIGFVVWLILCAHTVFLLHKAKKIMKKWDKPSLFLKYTMLALHISLFSTLIGGVVNSRIYYEFFYWQIAMVIATYSIIKLEFQKELEQE